MKIKYKMADGEMVDVEVTEEVAQSLKEMEREEWRQSKQIERNVMPISLTQMEDENGYQLVDYASDPLEQMIAKENQAERRAKIVKALKSLTPVQLELVKLLKNGKSISEIARLQGKHYSVIADTFELIRKKFKEFL